MKKISWNVPSGPPLGAGLLAVAALQAHAATAPSKQGSSASPASGPGGRAGASSRVAAEGRLVAYPGAAGRRRNRPRRNARNPQSAGKGPWSAGESSWPSCARTTTGQLSPRPGARLTEADAEIRLAEAEVDRARSLCEKAVGSRQALDKAERDVADGAGAPRDRRRPRQTGWTRFSPRRGSCRRSTASSSPATPSRVKRSRPA